jgi:Na+/melibiose symporter-like transporter
MGIYSGERRTIFRSSKLKVRLSHNIAYALPYSCVIFLYTPITILQGVYVKYYGFSLATIALVILGARVFDAISDPLVGYFSDTYFAKTGTRKPFIVVGGILFSVSGYFLYSPPANVGVSYFAFWFISFYLGWTLFEIPHLTWGGRAKFRCC